MELPSEPTLPLTRISDAIIDAQHHEVHEIQFPPVAAPARDHAAVDRHLNSAGALRKWPDVDLASAGLVGAVRDPFPVGRDLRIPLVGLGLEDRFRLVLGACSSSAETLQMSPDVFGIASPVDQPIARPAHRHRGTLELDQQILPARVVRELDIQPPLAVPPRSKCDPRTVGRPDGRGVVLCGVERESSKASCFRPRRSRYPRRSASWRCTAARLPSGERSTPAHPPGAAACSLVPVRGRPSAAADRRWHRPLRSRRHHSAAACRCGSFR